MKLKEIDRTANVAWSPACQHPIYLAAGTAAQQLDATFSTTASLEFYTLNLNEAGQEMELAGTIQTDSRFHKLVWGSYGIDSNSAAAGLLMAGAEQGQLFVWDAAKIINGDDDSLVHKFTKHTGPVAALDINPFQMNLVASGASESEIFIWDLNNADKPMTPGTKAQPAHDVSCVTWNRQVQHILASSHAGNCIVWDLRKNEPIIKIRDSMSHMKCNVICWHPDIATQLCMSSEDDHTPVIQLWDLRSATSPLKLLESHHRGILSMAWCPCDSDLLMSCGKDNRILCWNPNSESRTGEVVYELPTGSQWSFDVQWCPRNPAVVSSCSFDGHISVYSLMGSAVQSQTSSKVAEAFPLDSFSQPLPAHSPETTVQPTMLKKPPKWLRRPVGATFAFGGKLVTFESQKVQSNQQQHTHFTSTVTVSQVVTETELVSRSLHLEQTLASGQYTEFIDAKIASSKDDVEAAIWRFLKVNFEPDSRQHYLSLLGYNQSDINKKVNEALRKQQKSPVRDSQQLDHLPAELSDDFSTSPFDGIDNLNLESSGLPIRCASDCDGLITQALLTANFESAVEVCLANERWAEAVILAIAGGPELLVSTEKRFFESNKSSVNQLIWAVVTQKFESIVESCDLENWREALAIILTYSGGEDFTKLCDLLGKRLETADDPELAANAHLCYIVSGNTERLVSSWNRVIPETNSHQTLQDLIEKVMILWKGVESGQSLQNIAHGHLSKRLHLYAQQLASQGCISTAINYLSPVSSDDASVAILKDRLNQSLGLRTAGAKPFRAVNVLPEMPKQMPVEPQRTDSRSRTTSATYQERIRTTSGASYNQPGVVDGILQPPYPQMTDYMPGPGVGYPLQQPVPLPTPSHITKGPLRKYSGNASSAANDSQSAPFLDTYANNQYGGPTNQPTYISPGAPNVNLNPATYPPPAAHQAGSMYNPAQPTAWNDPPVVKEKLKVNKDHAPGAPQLDYNNLLNPAEYQPAAPQLQPQRTPHQPQVQPTALPPQVPAAAPVEPAAQNVQRNPTAGVPVEHQILLDVFNQLLQLCSVQASHNAQIKRKLEDVARKLENLYSKLAAGTLSASTTAGLHQIVQAVQSYDYQRALAFHAQIVGAGSFTEISTFMPGIKMLMQTAMQLQVYIQ